jgi:predicted alpha/beta hydrolase family esterase
MSFYGVGQTGDSAARWGVQQAAGALFYGLYEKAQIFFTDLLPANVTCVLPNAYSWLYRTLWTGSISSCTLQSAAGKTAHLFTHGIPARNGPVPALLLLHGDHAHPLTLLHLADIAEAEGRAVFSVHLPYDDNNPQDHRSLLHQSIEKVSEMIGKRGGSVSSLLLAGHSRGAIEAASEAYVANNQKVNGVIALAGRFKVVEPSTRPCRETLKPTVNAIWQKVNTSSLRVPFYQIAANQDWCIDPEASIVRKDQPHRFVNAEHLGVINHPDTLGQFKAWVSSPG